MIKSLDLTNGTGNTRRTEKQIGGVAGLFFFGGGVEF